jgi:CheY-like chemotaxis protein
MEMHPNSDIDEGNGAKSAQSPGLEAELARCRETLQRETLRRAEFLAHLNQALRTPLNAIMGFAELLEMKLGGDDNIGQIRKAARDLLDVINHELTEPIDTPSPMAAAANSRCDILYIEDNPANFALVERILEDRPSLKVLQAARGETGVALAQSHDPKLILLDLNLPDAHGSEVLRRLQQNPATARIPVVVVSADATPSQIERLLSAGARNYLTKPFDISPFLALVDETLGQPAGATS